jgi:hypothetical protein
VGEMSLSKLTASLKNEMTKEQQESMADLLTELLVLYNKAAEHIRPNIMFMCEGIAEILPDDLVNKCEDYAIYRTIPKENNLE